MFLFKWVFLWILKKKSLSAFTFNRHTTSYSPSRFTYLLLFVHLFICCLPYERLEPATTKASHRASSLGRNTVIGRDLHHLGRSAGPAHLSPSPKTFTRPLKTCKIAIGTHIVSKYRPPITGDSCNTLQWYVTNHGQLKPIQNLTVSDLSVPE